MLSVDEYDPLIETLMTFEPPVHVFGSFAEDALLHSASVRAHDDVDVLVGRDELEAQLRNAQAIAFSSLEVRYEPIAGAPKVIGTTDGHSVLEITRVTTHRCLPIWRSRMNPSFS